MFSSSALDPPSIGHRFSPRSAHRKSFPHRQLSIASSLDWLPSNTTKFPRLRAGTRSCYPDYPEIRQIETIDLEPMVPMELSETRERSKWSANPATPMRRRRINLSRAVHGLKYFTGSKLNRHIRFCFCRRFRPAIDKPAGLFSRLCFQRGCARPPAPNLWRRRDSIVTRYYLDENGGKEKKKRREKKVEENGMRIH